MVIRAIYPPQKKNPYDYLEPREVQTYSIAEFLVPVTPIPERGTELPYHESYTFWTNPENRITRDDLEALYQYQLGDSYKYCSSSEPLSEKWYIDEESQDISFSIPSVWGGNQR